MLKYDLDYLLILIISTGDKYWQQKGPLVNLSLHMMAYCVDIFICISFVKMKIHNDKCLIDLSLFQS